MSRTSLLWSRAHQLRTGRAWATNLALCALGFTLLCLARQFVSESDHFTIGFSGVSGWSATVYIASVLIILTQPTNRASLWIILGFGLAARLVPLFADPFLSSDIYRYVWDGVVQHAGINPYHYVPGNPALTWLRKPNQEVFDNINRRDYARTIYPPIAQMIYFCATWLSPTVNMMKTIMLLFECVAVGGMLALLRRLGRPTAQILLYAWCPLLVWELGDGGHVDAAVIAFIVLALLFRARGHNALTGLFLGLAVMTKFYPLVLFPALYRRGDWKMPAAIAAVVVAGYATYSSAGRLVFGFAGGYAKEEGMDTGARYFMLQLAQSIRGLHSLSTLAYIVFCGVVFGLITAWCWVHASRQGVVNLSALTGAQGLRIGDEPTFLTGSLMLGLALMLLFSPHYPWYIIWLVPIFTLAPRLPLLTYLMGFFYLFTTALADGTIENMFRLNRMLYTAVLIAALIQLMFRFVLRRWPSAADLLLLR